MMLKISNNNIQNVKLSPNNNIVALQFYEEILVQDFITGNIVSRISDIENSIKDFCFSPDGH